MHQENTNAEYVLVPPNESDCDWGEIPNSNVDEDGNDVIPEYDADDS